MRFMFFITSAHTTPPTPELIEAMDKLANQEIKAGRMIDTGGLMPLAMGARVTLKDDKLALIDGPFVEPRRWSAATRSSKCRARKRPSPRP